LTRIPILEEAPIPPKKPSGTEMTSAHGQEITKKIHALWIQSAQPPPKINGGKIAKITAPMVTTGV
jgi:hypothetical protein